MKSIRRLTLVKCIECGFPTTWHHAWRHAGRCRPCIEEKAVARLADERRARILARTAEEEAGDERFAALRRYLRANP